MPEWMTYGNQRIRIPSRSIDIKRITEPYPIDGNAYTKASAIDYEKEVRRKMMESFSIPPVFLGNYPNLTKNANAYMYKDYGSNYFDGDFENGLGKTFPVKEELSFREELQKEVTEWLC